MVRGCFRDGLGFRSLVVSMATRVHIRLFSELLSSEVFSIQIPNASPHCCNDRCFVNGRSNL
jgi:hypothetical protein